MNVLVLNCGSSSIKSQIIDTASSAVLSKVAIERIGNPDAILTAFDAAGRRRRHTLPVKDFDAGLDAALAAHCGDLCDIPAVGHRIVHGGERFTEAALLTPEVVHAIEDLITLAPLHNPHNLRGYYAARRVLPQARHVAVFDTAFHHTLPPKAFLYGLPYAYYTRDKIRRYGFHGISHRYVSQRCGAPKVITCHLGNGASLCAVANGVSVDTSMGFTPLEGLLMGTRSGDVDPSAVLALLAQEDATPQSVENLLNRQSGLLGLSGLSPDMRMLLDARANQSGRAALAIEVFTYRIRKYIGAYWAVLNGADALVFTGGIGENSPAIRAEACAGLEAFGIEIDPLRNEATVGIEGAIHRGRTPVHVIPANEELLIARDTEQCLASLAE
ncbi:MAG: acetate/propionate family kinase [Acidobacteriota bacterium]|jgi:acetate kinase|nr:acetate kinase [Bryobacteraceae bacterium CoA2 C42]MCA2964265.1 acetate kinase [Acidobacteriaceae bacterium]